MAEPPAGAAHATYAIVDLARAPFLNGLLDTLHPDEVPCLFAGKLNEQLRRASPHLLALRSAPSLVARWRAEGFGQAWGIFLTSPLGLEMVRRHIRHFLQVRLPDGSGPVLFRLWDPRVMAPFLATLEPDQARAIFAKLSSIVVEGPAGLTRHVPVGEGVRTLPAHWGEFG